MSRWPKGHALANPFQTRRDEVAPKIEVKALIRICLATYLISLSLRRLLHVARSLQDALKDLLYDKVPAKGEKYFPR